MVGISSDTNHTICDSSYVNSDVNNANPDTKTGHSNVNDANPDRNREIVTLIPEKTIRITKKGFQ